LFEGVREVVRGVGTRLDDVADSGGACADLEVASVDADAERHVARGGGES
jgi:hypothetical protein